MTVPMGSDWPFSIPTGPVHPAREENTHAFSVQQLIEIGAELLEQFLRRVVLALNGVFIPFESAFDQLREWVLQIPILGSLVEALTGIVGGGLNTLTEWTEGIPIIGDLVRAFAQFVDPEVDLDLSFLGDWVSDLLDFIGNPFGLGSGSVGIPLLDNIPILGPLMGGIVQAVTGMLGGDFGFLGAWFGDVTGLLGNPGNLGSGNPILGGLADIPLLGPIFGLVQNVINAIIQAISGIPVVGGTVAELLSRLTGLNTTANTASDNVNSLSMNLWESPQNVIGNIADVFVDAVNGTLGTLLGGLFAGSQPHNKPTGAAGGTGTGDVPIPGTGADGAPGGVAGVYRAAQQQNYQIYQLTAAAPPSYFGADGAPGSAFAGQY